MRNRGNGRLDPTARDPAARVGEGLGGNRDSAGGAGDAWRVRLVWQ